MFKTIQIFILLSHVPAFISNAIYVGKRSFNPPSTTSWLIFLRSLPSHHHHLCSHHHHSLSSSHQHSQEPLPSFEGCGLNCQHSSDLKSTNPATAAPPLLRGMWAAPSRLTEEELGIENARGDPETGRPMQYVPKTNHDESRGSFSPIPPSLTRR
jgi:hypothetical protein